MPPKPGAERAETRQIGHLEIRAEFKPATVDKEKRTVELTWSTGETVRRDPWWGDPYHEELSMDPSAIRMERLTTGRAPLLNAHDSYKLDKVIGVVQSAKVENGVGTAKVKFSKRASVEDILQDVADGVLANVSVGYSVHRYEEVSDAEKKKVEEKTRAAGGHYDASIPHYRAVDWEPLEISMVPMGADSQACVRARAGDAEEKHPCQFILRADSASNKGATMPPKQEGATAVRQDAGTPDKKVEGQQPSAAEIAKAERQRSKDIRSAVRLARLDEKFAEGLVDDGSTLEEARAKIFDEMAKRSEAQGNTTTRITVGREPTDVLFKGCTDALLTRYNSKIYPHTEEGKLYRGYSLMDFGREFLAAAGISTRGLGKMELAAAMLAPRGDYNNLHKREAGLMDTTDFPSLLANVLNKTLRQAYEYAPKTYEPLTRYTEAPDFKPLQRTQLGDSPTLVKVGEGGEITYGTVGDAKEVYALATYARILAVTRQTIINDDLDALTRIPSQYGVAAAQLQSDLSWGIITANAAMGDGVALFHATHGNLAAGGNIGAISVATIGAGRSSMRQQTGLNGMRINLQPKYLVVPTALETLADQYVTAAFLANQPSNTNPFASRMQVITEPRLDAVSATNWYLAADPTQIDILEMAFLQGQQGVYVETKIGFEVDGVQVKARLDCAAKAIDWRGLYKVPN